MGVESEDSYNSDLEKSAMNIDEWGIVEQRETFYEDDIVREYGGNYYIKSFIKSYPFCLTE